MIKASGKAPCKVGQRRAVGTPWLLHLSAHTLCVYDFVMLERRYLRIFLFVCLLILLYFLFQIFRPFLFPVALAIILTSLSYPVFSHIVTLLKGRQSWAALLTCIGITALIVIPFVGLLILLAGEVSHVYQQFQHSLDAGDFERLDPRNHRYFGPILQWVNQYLPLDELDLIGSFATVVQQTSLFFLRHSTAILSGLFRVGMDFTIMVVTMFFLFRDGSQLIKEIKSWFPLSRSYERRIVAKFREVADATVLGSLVTALAQGVAGGLVFWILGIPNPLLWGVLTALFSLVPVVGTAIVWLPWALYFFSTGHILTAVLLVVLEIGFVGTIDNILRPKLIEGRTKMHTLLVFFSIVGGISYFGIAGMLFGPIIVAIGLTFVELYKLEFQEELSKSTE